MTKTSTIQSVARPRNIDGGQRFTSNSVENNGVDITERSTTTTTNKFISTTTENHRKNDRRNNVRAISVPSGSRNNQPVCNKYCICIFQYKQKIPVGLTENLFFTKQKQCCRFLEVEKLQKLLEL